jgi:hypothetical protein
MKHWCFLFGEAERGSYCIPTICDSLAELFDRFGSPPEDSLGLLYAVQTLLYQRGLIYFRVREEGFSLPDYKCGLRLLRNKEIDKVPTAICLPGVGNSQIIDETAQLCRLFSSLLVTTERDFYDYITM